MYNLCVRRKERYEDLLYCKLQLAEHDTQVSFNQFGDCKSCKI